MIEVKVSRKATEIAMEGELAVLLADTELILRAIYNAIKKEDADEAEYYKKVVQEKVVRDCFGDIDIAWFYRRFMQEMAETEGN